MRGQLLATLTMLAISTQCVRASCRDIDSSTVETLAVAANETVVLCPDVGLLHLKKLTVADNGTLSFSRTLTLMADVLDTSGSARIVYNNEQAPPDDIVNLTLSTQDARAVKSLSIIANGKNAIPYSGAEVRAHDGAPGNNAQNWQGILPKANGSTSGGWGASGKKGRRGGNAANVLVQLPLLDQGSEIAVSAIGGNGGPGQDGGNGGKGGDGSNAHPKKDGGRGGNAGDGGDGGNSGKIEFDVILADRDVTNKNAQAESFSEKGGLFHPIFGAGIPGDAGRPGKGGPMGSGGVPTTGSVQNGQNGGAGRQGQPGLGPVTHQTRVDKKWATVQVVPASVYFAQYDLMLKRFNQANSQGKVN